LFETIADLLLLFFLGSLGWALFTPLKVPAAALLGTITVVGTLRIVGYPLPVAPDFFSPAVQIFLGLFVGSKVTRDTLTHLKAMIPPALLIVIWALGLVFGMGYFISRITYLDPVTAILSSSVGGLPEMTVIGLATSADIPAMITIKLVRMLATIFTFPFLVKLVANNELEKNNMPVEDEGEKGDDQRSSLLKEMLNKLHTLDLKLLLISIRLSLLSLGIAACLWRAVIHKPGRARWRHGRFHVLCGCRLPGGGADHYPFSPGFWIYAGRSGSDGGRQFNSRNSGHIFNRRHYCSYYNIDNHRLSILLPGCFYDPQTGRLGFYYQFFGRSARRLYHYDHIGHKI